MTVNFTASKIAGFVVLGFPDESGGVVGYQAVVGIPQYNIIVKYDLMGYSDQIALLDEQQTLVNASVEAVDGDIVIKLKNLLLEEGRNEIFLMAPITSSMHFLALLVRGMDQTGSNLLLILAWVGFQIFLSQSR